MVEATNKYFQDEHVDCGMDVIGPRSVRSGSGSRAADIPSMTTLLYSGCFVNLKTAAYKLLKGAAAETYLNSVEDKLKKLREYICVLEEKLPIALNEEGELKMKKKEDEKLWEGLESEFSSTMTLCDELSETLIHLRRLADHVHDVGEDKDCFEVEMSTSLGALGILKRRLHYHFKRLVWALRKSGKELRAKKKYFRDDHIDYGIDVTGSSIVDIKTNNMFRSQLNVARMTNSLVVMLFYKGYTRIWKSVLRRFADLTDDYCARVGYKITFLTVDVKSVRKMYKVKSIPTAVVIKGDDREEVGRICGADIARTFITRLKRILDDWIKCHYRVDKVEDLFICDDCFYC